MARKRPRPEELVNDFQQRLQADLNSVETHPLQPPSANRQLFGNDGSATRLLGQQDTAARKSRIDPPFRGLGAGAPVINSGAVFNPRPGPMEKPLAAQVVYFQDDSERSWGWSTNDSLTYYKNVKLIRKDYGLTLRCLGKEQALFVYRSDSITSSESLDGADDVKIASISALNMMLEEGSQADSVEPYTSIEEVLDKWVFWGVFQNMLFSSLARTRKMPIVNAVIHGYVKCAHYWAGCIPRARNGSYVGFYLARRPRDPIKAGCYRDMLNKILLLGDLTSASRQQKTKAANLIHELHEYDQSFADEECKFVWEPYVTQTREDPPRFLYSGPGGSKNGWEGYAKRWGFILSGTSGVNDPSCYRQNVEQALYPTPDTLEKMEYALRALPSIEFAVAP